MSQDLQSLRQKAEGFVLGLQNQICEALEKIEGPEGGRFHEDAWERAEGGGGWTRTLEGGRVFEKAAVNVSKVFGQLDPSLISSKMPGDGREFFATGVSVIVHPQNPYVPTTHCNYRFLTRGSGGWFGGGADLTPYYAFPEDAVHFHRTLKRACDPHGQELYPEFKEWCDQYFYLKHRQEARGIGGIFFDYVTGDLQARYQFWKDVGEAFLAAYLPIVQRRMDMDYGERERAHQAIRRGRYVEFNLIWDRGTLFGLKTGGRIESILASMPPQVQWRYDHHPEPGSAEAELLEFLKPRDWAAEDVQGGA